MWVIGRDSWAALTLPPLGSSAFPPLRGGGWWDPSGVDEFAFLVCASVVSCHNAFSALYSPTHPHQCRKSHLSTHSDSRTTWDTYARELMRWHEFLQEEFGAEVLGGDVVHQGDDFLRAYYLLRVEPTVAGDSAGRVVGDAKSTLGKRRAALVSFYRWAVEVGELERLPFRTTTVRTRYGPVETLAGLLGGRLGDGERLPIPEPNLSRLMSVGLLGQQPDGTPDPGFGYMEGAYRSAAGVALSVGAGLRHQEVLGTTVFELPAPHRDGLTPLSVAAAIAKGGRARKVIAFSRWMQVVVDYIRNERAAIAMSARWRPPGCIEVDPDATDRRYVTLRSDSGGWERKPWDVVDLPTRRRLVVPDKGSPLLLLNARSSNGSPLVGPDALNLALSRAAERCAGFWPDQFWSYTMHNCRHTYGTGMLRFLKRANEHIEEFEKTHGRPPVWAEMAKRDDALLLVADSMGHASVDTTRLYVVTALWELLLEANADEDLNPALVEA